MGLILPNEGYVLPRSCFAGWFVTACLGLTERVADGAPATFANAVPPSASPAGAKRGDRRAPSDSSAAAVVGAVGPSAKGVKRGERRDEAVGGTALSKSLDGAKRGVRRAYRDLGLGGETSCPTMSC